MVTVSQDRSMESKVSGVTTIRTPVQERWNYYEVHVVLEDPQIIYGITVSCKQHSAEHHSATVPLKVGAHSLNI